MNHGCNQPKAPPQRSKNAWTKNPQRPDHPSFPDFEAVFSERAILGSLCTWRVSRSKKRNDALFLHRIKANPFQPKSAEYDTLFPPRRTWHRYRPRSRGERPGPDLNRKALMRAILAHWMHESPEPWVLEIKQFVANLRQRVLSDDVFRFAEPRIHAELKDQKTNEYRPIAIFKLEDRIIENLLARYLRACLDEVFDDASYAFRGSNSGRPVPTHHDAVRQILQYRHQCGDGNLYVAECDIKGFFDCVDHSLARQSFLATVAESEERAGGDKVAPRALQMFDAYLNCYSFPRVVLEKAQPDQAAKTPGAFFKWPTEELGEFHADPRAAAIGIPQGGAVSALIVNCLLHKADRKLREMGNSKTFTYLRFCDDMIILSPSKAVCQSAYQAYCATLRELRLLIHAPTWTERAWRTILDEFQRRVKTVDWAGQPLRRSWKQWMRQMRKPDWPGRYGEWFWRGKSRPVYRWAPPLLWFKRSPWIQFVGYQIRFDGQIRIRKSSIDKHTLKIREAVKGLLHHIGTGHPEGGRPASPVRKSIRQIHHRLRMHLISMAVGRRNLVHKPSAPLPMSWCSGFVCLNNQPFVVAQLKALDRHREHQLNRLRRVLATKFVCPRREPGEEKSRVYKKYGHPFSYYGQFLSFRRVPTRVSRIE